VIGTDHRLSFYIPRPFYDPLVGIIVMKATIVTNKFLEFAIFILSAGYTKHIIAPHPKNYVTGTFRTIPVSINRLGEPNPVTESEVFVCKRTYGTYINHIP
jgi:hypothetical protein